MFLPPDVFIRSLMPAINERIPSKHMGGTLSVYITAASGRASLHKKATKSAAMLNLSKSQSKSTNNREKNCGERIQSKERDSTIASLDDAMRVEMDILFPLMVLSLDDSRGKME